MLVDECEQSEPEVADGEFLVDNTGWSGYVALLCVFGVAVMAAGYLLGVVFGLIK